MCAAHGRSRGTQSYIKNEVLRLDGVTKADGWRTSGETSSRDIRGEDASLWVFEFP